MFTIGCCLLVGLGLGLGLGLDLVYGWYVVMHTYLRDVGLQLSRLDRPLLQIRDTKASVTIKSSLCRKKQFAATK